MIPSAHVDTYARDNLPPQSQWPEFLFTLPELQYPERLNCVRAFVDRWVEAGEGGRTAILGPDTTWSYTQLYERINRIANVLTRDLGMVPGNRVLLRAPNSPMAIAAYLAVIKAGGVMVATMPLLRAKELAYPVTKAKIALALCDARLTEEMEKTKAVAPDLKRVVYWGTKGFDDLEALMDKPGYESFQACDTALDDVCLIAFTSGTTGEPKGTMHFHRDMLATADSFSHYVLQPDKNDRFIGSAPLAFTFGLGGHVLFPFRVGAATIQLEKTTPEDLLSAIAKYRATVCFTAPTAYRAMAAEVPRRDISSLRKCVSAGETLPRQVFEMWEKATGIRLMDGLGGTEVMHIYVCAKAEAMKPGKTGIAVPGYIVRVVDDAGNEVPRGTPGHLALRGPTGCRYLADSRQTTYVRGGWNYPGDTYIQDEDGYFVYQARSDDMIISAGYNIAGPEVESVLLTHPAVAECGVVGAPDEERGHIVKAYVVLRPGFAADATLTKTLQDFVKTNVAPYKYPRAIEFVTALPKTQTGKLQRFELRKMASASAQKMAS